ncbi:hypothetical protein BJ741DRAFT_610220 [Chytriomyces cf. hyalinus JEL632]|nr:hypothetical protein BJ741DRAFT_610220 [Chytriomyces cf. hyalinus JEL632]
MSDLNWCSCGKATQPGTMYCSTLCRTADEESNKPTSSSWSLDNAANINTSSPIAFYPYNHFANVAMQSPRSPFMTLLPQTTPKFAAAASPRFTGSSSRGGASNSPFALGSIAAGSAAGNLGAASGASIPFLALPQSELDLPPLELDGSKKLEVVGGNLSGAHTRMDPLISKSRRASANIQFSPLSHPTSSATVAPPVVSNHPRTSVRNILESPMMSGRIPPPSPRMTGGSQDMSCAAGPNGGGLVTVAGSNAMLDDCYVSLAFNNRVRK